MTGTDADNFLLTLSNKEKPTSDVVGEHVNSQSVGILRRLILWLRR